MRSLTIVLVLGMLVACASSGGYLEYKPEHWRGQLWAITAKAETGEKEDTVTVNINDTNVLFGTLSKESPEDIFFGSYEGYDISASCRLAATQDKASRHSCTLTVDGEEAGVLSF